MVHSKSIKEIDLNSLNTVIELNLRPAVQLTQAFLPSMKDNSFGRILKLKSQPKAA